MADMGLSDQSKERAERDRKKGQTESVRERQTHRREIVKGMVPKLIDFFSHLLRLFA